MATPGGIPWRSVGAGLVSLGTPFGAAVLRPLLGEMMIVIELGVFLTMLGTALYGSETLSERAFRLLRWLGNRLEPPGPDRRRPGSGPGRPDRAHESRPAPAGGPSGRRRRRR
jgi:hypothetical protein